MALKTNTFFLLVGDLVIFLASLLLTLGIRYREIPTDTIINQHLFPFVLLFGIWIGVFVIAGLYDRGIFLARRRIPNLVFKTQFANILIAAFVFFVFPFGIEPKTNLVIYLIVSSVLIAVWRLSLFPFLSTGKPLRVLVVGESDEAIGVVQILRANPSFKNVRTFTLAHGDDVAVMRQVLYGIGEKESLDMIIADMRDPKVTALAKDFYALALKDAGTAFYHLPTVYEQMHHRIPPSLVGEVWVLENLTTSAPHYAYDFLKRMTDVAGALLLFVPFLCIAPAIAIAIKLDSNGPLFYKTERVGQGGRIITLYKFRTKNGTDTGAAALQSTLVDTWVGTILRRTRLDELPQLLNVLRGDLSFVGPRPEMPALAEVYAQEIPYYTMRHRIKPGLSGWAQINHLDVPRSGIDVPRTITKLSFDLYYLKNRSILLDIEIALKTIGTLLLRTGS